MHGYRRRVEINSTSGSGRASTGDPAGCSLELLLSILERGCAERFCAHRWNARYLSRTGDLTRRRIAMRRDEQDGPICLLITDPTGWCFAGLFSQLHRVLVRSTGWPTTFRGAVGMLGANLPRSGPVATVRYRVAGRHEGGVPNHRHQPPGAPHPCSQITRRRDPRSGGCRAGHAPARLDPLVRDVGP